MTGLLERLWASRQACVGALGIVASLLLVGCGPSGAPAVRQAIGHALVWDNGRSVMVAASCGVSGLRLTAAQGDPVVRLRAAGHEWPGSGVACPPDAPRVHASFRLRAPLGDRVLVDATTGRRIPHMTEASLALPSWLPPGARGPTNSLIEGWTRTYRFPTRMHRGLLMIIETPERFANRQEFSPRLGRLTQVTLAGHPAVLLVVRRNGVVVEDEIGWHAGGYALIVKSRPLAAGRRPFGPAVLERLAASLSAG